MMSQSGNLTKHKNSHRMQHLRWNVSFKSIFDVEPTTLTPSLPQRNTRDKPFKCRFPGCTKSFTAKSSLQVHWRSHVSGESSAPTSFKMSPLQILRVLQEAAQTNPDLRLSEALTAVNLSELTDSVGCSCRAPPPSHTIPKHPSSPCITAIKIPT